GAYPIFYWSEKDYLIKNYKAIPPVNEENAPGKIATSPEELIQIVREAIATNYIIPEEIQQKYLRVNEFNDNQNTDRVIKELKKLDVL
ncbi:MAG TPA: CDP-glycerol glycerophosphotransferase family protein, partial [Pseudogracilibacillus sp.]|nr:CDP-glycerol glycerophosphotransferase family protein [Pseudogracilibacillus sp.]